MIMTMMLMQRPVRVVRRQATCPRSGDDFVQDLNSGGAVWIPDRTIYAVPTEYRSLTVLFLENNNMGRDPPGSLTAGKPLVA